MSIEPSPLRIGIAGLGTVGVGVLTNLQAHGERLAMAMGRRIEVTGVSARSRSKDRGVSLEGITWFDSPEELAVSPAIDAFVELIGGSDGPALGAVSAALGVGKSVVTANKALLARHGFEIAKLAEENGAALAFEASVAGGIPVIKTVRESLIGNEIRRVYGILNGTCNFILTKMEDEGRDFDDVLAEAQRLGYAEADPSFDIGGKDAAHKLAILTSLAFGTRVALDQIHCEGIEHITTADIQAADELGYRIKLLGVALKTESGIEARVSPAMVPKHSAIAEVSGVTNAVEIECDYVGDLLLVGPGAGANPTASSVVADIVDVARGDCLRPFILPASKLKPHTRATLEAHRGAYYVRLAVYDEPGALASIAGRMGEQRVSLESIVQRRPNAPEPAVGAAAEIMPLVLITHDTVEASIRKALKLIQQDGKIASRPQLIRIEKL
ncbi:MAG: homoserine dehydrogenase [Hyphomicrobiaceae bacterium]